MICPFCRKTEIDSEPGKTICPNCQISFEIDDRGECVFVDTENPKIPVDGLVCAECGLVQQAKRDSCAYCGTLLNKTVH